MLELEVVPITIGNNISSIGVQRHLGIATSSLQDTFEHLSSGQRINRASDDAAGLSIALSLNTSSRVFTQGIRNVNDAISVFNIAEGALSSLSDLSTRLQELSEQAANGTYGLSQRRSMQIESDELIKEFNRVVSSTTFNSISLLNGNFTSLAMQAGGSTVNLSFTSDLVRNVGGGAYQTPVTYTNNAFSRGGYQFRDINGDGKVDIVYGGFSSAGVFLGNGDGTFLATVTYAGSGQNGNVALQDLNGDGVPDIATTSSGGVINIFFGNSNGSF